MWVLGTLCLIVCWGVEVVLEVWYEQSWLRNGSTYCMFGS